MKIDSLLPEPEILREIGRRVARMRKQRGLSQDQLAEAAGVGVATLRRLETGSDAQIATWIKILRALDQLSGIENLVPETYRSPMHEVIGARRRKAGPAGGIRWGDEAS